MQVCVGLIVIAYVISTHKLRMSEAASGSDDSIRRGNRSTCTNKISAPTVGGGAINEKRRHYESSEPLRNSNPNKYTSRSKTNFDPQNQPAHLLHAITGLDRYPNYLSRWNHNLQDIDLLESALEEQLDKVRKQKQEIFQRNAIVDAMRQKVISRRRDEQVICDNSIVDEYDIFEAPKSWDEVRKYILDPSKYFYNVLYVGVLLA